MERLTVRSFDGSAHAKCVAYYDIIDKLAEYEDLEEQIMKKFAGCIDIKTILDSFCVFYDMQETNEQLAQCTLLTNEDVLKYRQWKEAEEQGMILRLPCKVGDTIYIIDDLNNMVLRGTVKDFTEDKIRTARGYLIHVEYKNSVISESWEEFSEVGKTVFLTKEEAEQALARMEKEK